MAQELILVYKLSDDGLHDRLREVGYNMIYPQTLAEAEEQYALHQPDVILSGSPQDLKELRSVLQGKLKPLLVLTPSYSLKELLLTFSEGAHDYIDRTKDPDEVIARIHNVQRLLALDSREEQLQDLCFEDVLVQVKKKKVFRGEEWIKLTPKEFDLMVFLMRNVHHVCSREDILHEVWGYDFRIDTNVVDVYIRHLRSKIDRGRSRKVIHTVRGSGYMIQ
ncbi:DNA-binding response OmpR family regulator [Paenibacillus shirakamiensis]|uniref:DNA-binding response OmpR family regulator n=1 Tax=Paenibacillus shirakamiensis TaxID=1265935 RepID=A0ABS4JDP1_9BACL|nr:response regulator transcription factor [Paenibacillus shirakamiensis]MBP1999813.1 DNA-binding response OmpR family regulator [Paenibacillus shirakamiensis]